MKHVRGIAKRTPARAQFWLGNEDTFNKCRFYKCSEACVNPFSKECLECLDECLWGGFDY